jgi:hypothetical protein
MCRLQGGRSKEILDNQKSIESLQKQHSKVMTELESDYRLDLTCMENQHNKSMVSYYDMFLCID